MLSLSVLFVPWHFRWQPFLLMGISIRLRTTPWMWVLFLLNCRKQSPTASMQTNSRHSDRKFTTSRTGKRASKHRSGVEVKAQKAAKPELVLHKRFKTVRTRTRHTPMLAKKTNPSDMDHRRVPSLGNQSCNRVATTSPDNILGCHLLSLIFRVFSNHHRTLLIQSRLKRQISN